MKPAHATLGVPKETKTLEGRVALTPDGVREFERAGVEVFVEKDAGTAASISDAEFVAAGATIVPTAADAWGQSMVVKVKEPTEKEFGFLRPDLTLFTYLHLAAYPKVADALLKHRTTGVAYETVQLSDGSLPLLAPMSEVAGRLATQAGAHYLQRPYGGRGVLMGGAPGVRPAKVVVIGAGNVGWNSAWIAAGMEAEVLLLDKNLDRLRFVDQIHRGRIVTIASNRGAIERSVVDADLVIGAVLVAGARAPIVVTEDMVKTMKRWRGDGGRCHRSGRLHRNDARNHPHRPRVRKTRRHSLRRRQHARSGAEHQHLRAHQRHLAVPIATGYSWCTRCSRERRRDGARCEHGWWCAHQQAECRGTRSRVRRAARGPARVRAALASPRVSN